MNRIQYHPGIRFQGISFFSKKTSSMAEQFYQQSIDEGKDAIRVKIELNFQRQGELLADGPEAKNLADEIRTFSKRAKAGQTEAAKRRFHKYLENQLDIDIQDPQQISRLLVWRCNFDR